jgi:choline dehydrogenase
MTSPTPVVMVLPRQGTTTFVQCLHSIRFQDLHLRVNEEPEVLRLTKGHTTAEQTAVMISGDKIFDYIVIGAGSAGCAVAARLSENGRYRVLLLEAGDRDRNPWIHVPMGYSRLFANPSVNWMYQSEPEEGLNGRTIYQPAGKVLGGTSSINGMVYMRGNPADYDGWQQRGCTGWGWESVLPYFKKAEDQKRGADAFHGVGGPLRVSDPLVRWELADHWIAAAVEAGLPANNDFNGARQEGAGYFQSTTNRGRRWSTAVSYLRPARRRPNFAIWTKAHATRILVENNRAIGVSFVADGILQTARASSEVIVCGGVFNTPQLLQLSGLGPAKLLHKAGIPVICDLPSVGADLKDHFNVRLAFRCTKRITLNHVANSLMWQALAGARYALFRSGPLANHGVCAGAFARSDESLDRPDLQFYFINWSLAERNGIRVRAHNFPGFSVDVVHLRSKSRGTVRIENADPFVPPAIRFNCLRSQGDVRALTAGLRLAREIAQQPALAEYVSEEILPGPKVDTDEEFEAMIRARGTSALHPVGTCRMGVDEGAVLDPRLRVRGVERLRVVDASIMPSLPAGNTNAPVIMIAEKASDMILEDAQG